MSGEPKELVPVEAGRPPDAYERAYMAGEGTVLYRDKLRAPWPLHAIFAAAALAVVGAAAASGELLGLVIGLPALAVVWLLLAVLRVTVSEGAVKVQYGVFGPTIPVAAIEGAEAVSYDWKQFGGWGIRRSRDGAWIYNMPGDGGRAVRITWRDGRGRRRVTLVGSRRAELLARAIARGRAALPGGATGPALGAAGAEDRSE